MLTMLNRACTQCALTLTLLVQMLGCCGQDQVSVKLLMSLLALAAVLAAVLVTLV